jgi:hypothetical protein
MIIRKMNAITIDLVLEAEAAAASLSVGLLL